MSDSENPIETAPVGKNPPVEERLEDLLIQLVIIYGRLYDVAITQLRQSNKQEADRLMEYHRRGGLMCPPASFDPKAKMPKPDEL